MKSKTTLLLLIFICGTQTHAADSASAQDKQEQIREALKKIFLLTGQENISQEMFNNYDVGYSIRDLLTHGLLPKVDYENGKLNLSNMRINSLDGFEELPREDLSRISMLILSHNQLQSLRGMPYLDNLEWLNVKDNKLSSVEGLPQLNNLTVLDLSNNSLQSIEEIPNLDKLMSLYLDKNRIKSAQSLNLPSLWRLTLADNSLRSTKDIPALDKLHELHLQGNPISQEYAAIEEIETNMPNVTVTH